MNVRIIFLGSMFALSVSSPAFAHHGWGGYQNAETNIVGTVVEQVNLAGAHASIKLQGEDGQIWRVILSPPHSTVAAGIREQTFPVGAKVTVSGHRHSDPSRLEMKTEELHDGPADVQSLRLALGTNRRRAARGSAAVTQGLVQKELDRHDEIERVASKCCGNRGQRFGALDQLSGLVVERIRT